LFSKRITCTNSRALFMALTEEEIIAPSDSQLFTSWNGTIEFQCKKGSGVFRHGADRYHTIAPQVYEYQLNTGTVRLSCEAFSRDLGLSSMGKNRVQWNTCLI
jgi:hypothetical protein